MCTGMEVALLATTAVSTASQVQQGSDAQAMGRYQANQAAADAEAERGAAKVYADKIRKAGEAERGRARAMLAASGASLDSASADAIDDDIVSAYEEDALVSMFGGENRARSRMAEGEAARIAGNQGKRNATISAATTAASGWYRVSDHRETSSRLQAQDTRNRWNTKYPNQRY